MLKIKLSEELEADLRYLIDDMYWYTWSGGKFSPNGCRPSTFLRKKFKEIFGYDISIKGNSKLKEFVYQLEISHIIFETEEDATLFFMTINDKIKELQE